jgi:CRP-like cAMP-binding protein
MSLKENQNPLFLQTNGSLGDEGSTSRGEKPPLLKKDLKYYEIWKRAVFKLNSEMRIQKVLSNLKRFNNNNPSQESLNTVEVEAVWKKNLNSTEENPQRRSKPRCKTIHPESKLRKFWDIYLGLWLIYSCIVTPINLAFFDPRPGDLLFVIDVIIDFSFLIDVFLNFFTGYYDKEGAVRVDLCEIIKNYLLTWFPLDIVAAFPSGLVEIIAGEETKYSRYDDIVRIVKLRNIIRLLKVTRTVKFLKYSQRESLLSSIQNFFKISHSTRRLITTLLMIVISIHIFACFFFYANVYNEFSPDSWAVRYGIQDSPVLDIYISSVYYSVVTITTIGYGDITPKTKIEKCLAMIWMVVAVYFLSFVISSLSSSLAQNDVKRALLEQKLALLDSFSEEVGIDKVTKKKIQDEIRLKILRSTYSSSLKSEIIQDLSSELKHVIATRMYNGIFEVFDVFKKTDQIFVSTIFPLLEAHHFIENEVVYSENDFPDYIYFIGRGRIHFLTPEIKKPFSILSTGAYFGEIEIVKNSKRMFSAVSPKETFLLGMGLTLIAKIKEEFSKVWDVIQTDCEKHQKMYIRELAQMKVCLRANTDRKLGDREFKKMKADVLEEMKTITIEINKKTDHNELRELVTLVKEEVKFNRETLLRIEARVKKLQKKEKHRFIKNKVQLPPIKKSNK